MLERSRSNGNLLRKKFDGLVYSPPSLIFFVYQWQFSKNWSRFHKAIRFEMTSPIAIDKIIDERVKNFFNTVNSFQIFLFPSSPPLVSRIFPFFVANFSTG